MINIVDYYEELKIDQSLRLDEINTKLTQSERTWRDRAVNTPEKAMKMISLIMDARKVFKTDASRAEYDRQLEESRKSPEISDPDENRRLALEKWKSQAMAYYNERQYDLAKISIDRAISQTGSDYYDDSLFALAAEIYMENGNSTSAMDYINKAIVSGPDISSYYITKGLIYDELISELNRYSDRVKAQDYLYQAREMYRQAVSRAEISGDNISKARALGALAFSLYFQENPDKKEAERLAVESEKIGGDSWGNAKRVLDDIAAIENARKEAIYSGAMRLAASREIPELENAISEFKRIKGYKDSVQQIEKLTGKVQSIREEEQRKRLEAQKERIETENARKRAIYLKALELANSKEISKLANAISEFERIKDYKDSEQRIEKLIDKIRSIREEKKARRKRSIPIIVVSVLAVLLIYNVQRHRNGDSSAMAPAAELPENTPAGNEDFSTMASAAKPPENTSAAPDDAAADIGTDEADTYYEMGRAYLYGLDGQEIDYEAAYDNFENALELGKEEANFYLGLLCDRYNYPELDYEKAIAYYEAAGGENLLQARFALGRMYYNGYGVEQDVAQAETIFENVIAAGCADGFLGMGGMAYDSGDYDTAFEDYNIVVEESEEQAFIAFAMSRIGYMYYDGQGVEQDYGKAMEWYEKAADLGSASAMSRIGYMYDNGEGVEQDYGKAMEWYEKAADLGSASAMSNIAYMYHEGQGVEQDYGKAMEWLEKAADLGDANAMYNIGYMYREGQGVERDYGKAMEWYEKAADLGSASAMNSIGVMYHEGWYVEQDYGKAMEWFDKAANLGNALAMNNIGIMYENGRGVERNSNKAQEWYDKAAAAENQ